MLISTVLSNAIALADRDAARRNPVVVGKKHVDNALLRHQDFKKDIDDIKGESEKHRSRLRVVDDEY